MGRVGTQLRIHVEAALPWAASVRSRGAEQDLVERTDLERDAIGVGHARRIGCALSAAIESVPGVEREEDGTSDRCAEHGEELGGQCPASEGGSIPAGKPKARTQAQTEACRERVVGTQVEPRVTHPPVVVGSARRRVQVVATVETQGQPQPR
jgi:hypothetical protein